MSDGLSKASGRGHFVWDGLRDTLIAGPFVTEREAECWIAGFRYCLNAESQAADAVDDDIPLITGMIENGDAVIDEPDKTSGKRAGKKL